MSRPRSGGPTQATIAQSVGVSISTVSKALRGDPSISRRTRGLVWATARTLGYHHASGERARREGIGRPLISILCDTVGNSYTGLVLEGMLVGARELDIRLEINHIGAPAYRLSPEILSLADSLARRAIEDSDGLVLVTAPASERILESCLERRIPVLAIDPVGEPPSGMMTLCATNWRGGLQAAEHLIGLGHERIGIVCGPRTSAPTADRLAGVRSAFARAGLPLDESLMSFGDYSYEAGLAEGARLLRLSKPPTAIFGLNDTIAVGVLEAARREGIRVPSDLSVVGFDDTAVASLCSPQLTVIRQPLHEIGTEAIRTIIRALDLGQVTGSPVEMQTVLVERDSTAPAPH